MIRYMISNSQSSTEDVYLHLWERPKQHKTAIYYHFRKHYVAHMLFRDFRGDQQIMVQMNQFFEESGTAIIIIMK